MNYLPLRMTPRQVVQTPGVSSDTRSPSHSSENGSPATTYLATSLKEVGSSTARDARRPPQYATTRSVS